MAGLCLFWILVGPTTALQLTLPDSSIDISTGNTALLSASLNVSPLVPNYFQLRWRFVTGNWPVLKLKANHCMVKNGTQNWRDSCAIHIETTERYKQRAKLSSDDTSLVLQDVRMEDSGTYSITVLALDMTSSANINLTVIEVDPGVPVSFVKAADDGDYTVSNSIQLGLAGLILCLLGLIIAEHISFIHCKRKKITAQDGREMKQHRVGVASTIPPEPGSTYLLMEKLNSEELYCCIDC